jgi:hypothetical protein
MAWSADRLQVLVAVVSERPAAVQMMNVEAGALAAGGLANRVPLPVPLSDPVPAVVVAALYRGSPAGVIARAG